MSRYIPESQTLHVPLSHPFAFAHPAKSPTHLRQQHVFCQVVLEMVELREVDTARAMLRQTPVFNRMKQEEPDRFLKLEHLCGRTYFDIRFVYVHLLDSPKQLWYCYT